MTWRVLGASVAGAAHDASGRGCDDTFAYAVVGDTVVIAVADGAGSAAHAADGAAIAVTAAVAAATEVVRRCADDAARPTAAWGAIAAARRAVEAEADRSGRALGQLAATLHVVVSTPAGAVVAAVGDGAAVVRCGAALEVPAPVTRGEFVNETTFLTSDRWLAEVRCAATPSVDAVAVCTDGVELLAIDLATGRPHPPFFEPLLAFAAAPDADPGALTTFLSSDRVRARTDDDCTLVLAVWDGAGG